MLEVYDNKYVTTQGETWDMISQVAYGTPFRIAELISCNSEHSDVLVFDGGIELNIPIITESTSTTLAPWKRGA